MMNFNHQKDADAATLFGIRPGQSHFIECQTCGHEPPDQAAPPPHECPKCGAEAWRRVYRPGETAPNASASRGGLDFRVVRTPIIRTTTRVYLARPAPPRSFAKGRRRMREAVPS